MKRYRRSSTSIPHATLVIKLCDRSPASSSQLDIYTDASFNVRARDNLLAKHHPPFEGYVILLDCNFLVSRSYTIRAATVSSVYEAELIALHDGVRRALAILPTLHDLGFTNVKINAYCDNSSLCQVVKSLRQVDYEELFLNRINYLRDKHNCKVFTMNHISGKVNPADILTKRMPFAEITRVLASCKFFSPHTQPSASISGNSDLLRCLPASEPGGMSGLGFPNLE